MVRNFQHLLWMKWNRFGGSRFCGVGIQEGPGQMSWMVVLNIPENMVEILRTVASSGGQALEVITMNRRNSY